MVDQDWLRVFDISLIVWHEFASTFAISMSLSNVVGHELGTLRNYCVITLAQLEKYRMPDVLFWY